MRNILLALLVILVIFKVYPQNLKTFQINYQLTYKSEETGNENVIKSYVEKNTDSEDLKITLLHNSSFIVSKNEIDSYYDLKNEMITAYNSDSLFLLVPIYHVIDYRDAEFKNRIFLADMLKSAGKSDVFGDMANLESLFGIESEGSEVRKNIEIKIKKDTLTFLYNKSELVRIHYSKTELPSEFSASFYKFLIYNTQVHPYIIEKIIKERKVPDYLSYNYANVGIKCNKAFALTGSKAEDFNMAKTDYKGKACKIRKSSAMERIIDSVLYAVTKNKMVNFDSSKYINESKRLLKAGNYLSATLCLLEYSLSTGKQLTPQLNETLSAGKSDSLLGIFLNCMNTTKSKKEAQLKIVKLKALIDRNMEFGYVLNIFCANFVDKSSSGETEDFFLEALRHNPNITGAWHDLGKFYASMYNFEDAWKCYQILISLYPTHSMAQEIQAYKVKLKKTYPLYFSISED